MGGDDKGGEFFTFDEVLRQLSIDETRLKRLVSEGEIRAFREGDQMKFRKADVENLDLTGARSEEECGVIDLSVGKKGDSEELTDDVIFDEGDDLDLSSAEAGMATAVISSGGRFVDENVGMRTDFVEPEAQAEKSTEKEPDGLGGFLVVGVVFLLVVGVAVFVVRSFMNDEESKPTGDVPTAPVVEKAAETTKVEDPNRILTWEEQLAKARAKVKAGETKK